ncbi:hypothetical protein CTEN210_02237 [Chaetoceros tenuissimus]|uniref:EamA domain-containing protein n=1 Tax=Chaetoceros tenuissimus TaxID=426638 RepID=A0AAD3CHK0_9STRA|nr:hypothetical protein CTEN210_02237 [Chaetoceros tenuissimus]
MTSNQETVTIPSMTGNDQGENPHLGHFKRQTNTEEPNELTSLLVIPTKANKHERHRSSSMPYEHVCQDFDVEESKWFHRSSTSVDTHSQESTRANSLMVEFKNIGQALKDHLHEAYDDEDFFLGMTLTKNLSILRDKKEIQEVHGQVTDALRRNDTMSSKVDDTLKKDEVEHIPLNAYLILGSAVVALSSIGPFLAAQKGVSGEMKIVWRFQGTAMMLGPFAIQEIISNGIPRLSLAQWGTFFMAATSYSVLCVAFALSVNFTSVTNATILTNSQSILLVVGKMCVGQPIVFLEALGVFVAFSGAILSAKESADREVDDESFFDSLWGDALGLISSIGGIGYIVLGKSLRSSFPVLLFMVLNMLTASFIILLFMYVTEQEISLSRDVNHGIFGWMNIQPDRLPLEIGTVFVCNVLGTMGYVRAFKYFSSVIIAVAALLEPVVASFTAVAMGVGVLPGIEGWLGNILVIVGTIAVLYPTIERSNKAISSQ